MAKYKVKHTSIMHNKTLYKEGSTIELTDEQAAKLSDFVEIVKTQTTSTKTETAKSSAKTKSASKAENKNADGSKGGSVDDK